MNLREHFQLALQVFQVLLLLTWAVFGTIWSTWLVPGIVGRMQAVTPTTLCPTGSWEICIPSSEVL